MDIVYKTIGQEDVESYYNLVNEVKDEGKYLFSTLRFPIKDTVAYVKMHEENNCPIIGAFDDNKIVGWIDYNRGTFEEVSHTASVGMAVQKKYRGNGIGYELLKECIKSAKQNGIEKLELEVFSTNERAYHVYTKMGFVEEGRKIRKRKFCNAYEDLILMGLFIGEI